MSLIPGKFIALLTFPGVIIHELGHRIFCELVGVQVYKTCYFRFGNPAGYVIHEAPERYSSTFLIAVAPFIFNTIVALTMFSIAPHISVISVLFYWLGFSIGMHAFPSSGDAASLWQHTMRIWKQNPIALLGLPFVLLILLANILSVIWFDLIYAALLWFLVNHNAVTHFFSRT
jgi:hypothetical protein